jgi:surfeit locus 1 family protein
VRPRTLLLAVVLLGAAAVCVRLGFWQISRLREKRALNAAMRAAMASPPEPYVWGAPGERWDGHRVYATGRFDDRVQVLLSARSRDGSPGVDVVTPLVVGDGKAVLVDRGWLYSGDATWARAQDYPDEGERRVVGIARPIPDAGLVPTQVRREDGKVLVSMRRLVRDSLSARVPYTLSPVLIQELPGPGVPPQPARAAPRPADESMHLSYAVQWFVFAAIMLFGPLVVTAARRRPNP